MEAPCRGTARCPFPNQHVVAPRGRSVETARSQQHHELIGFNFRLVSIERTRRGPGGDDAFAIERAAMTRTAELIRASIPPHDAAKVRTRRLVRDDLLAQPRD